MPNGTSSPHSTPGLAEAVASLTWTWLDVRAENLDGFDRVAGAVEDHVGGIEVDVHVGGFEIVEENAAVPRRAPGRFPSAVSMPCSANAAANSRMRSTIPLYPSDRCAAGRSRRGRRDRLDAKFFGEFGAFDAPAACAGANRASGTKPPVWRMRSMRGIVFAGKPDHAAR